MDYWEFSLDSESHPKLSEEHKKNSEAITVEVWTIPMVRRQKRSFVDSLIHKDMGSIMLWILSLLSLTQIQGDLEMTTTKMPL